MMEVELEATREDELRDLERVDGTVEAVDGAIVVACSRPAVRDLIARLDPRARLIDVPIRSVVSPFLGRGVHPAVGVVDMGSDPFEAPALCRALKQRLPATPIVAVVCCVRCVPARELRSLFEADVIQSVVGLQAGEVEMHRAIVGSIRGQSIVNLELSDRHPSARLSALLGEPERAEQEMLSPLERQLVTLLTQGRTDREIGRVLHLSPHTVHHRIQRLCSQLAIRNRVELAAWGGRTGLYPATQPPSLDLVTGGRSR
jgi:DNA-binding NarL/FixJ family response regulator